MDGPVVEVGLDEKLYTSLLGDLFADRVEEVATQASSSKSWRDVDILEPCERHSVYFPVCASNRAAKGFRRRRRLCHADRRVLSRTFRQGSTVSEVPSQHQVLLFTLHPRYDLGDLCGGESVCRFDLGAHLGVVLPLFLILDRVQSELCLGFGSRLYL